MREIGKVHLNSHRHLESIKEPNLVEEKPLLGQDNILFGYSQWEQGQRASLLDSIGHIPHFYIRSVKLEKLKPFL